MIEKVSLWFSFEDEVYTGQRRYVKLAYLENTTYVGVMFSL